MLYLIVIWEKTAWQIVSSKRNQLLALMQTYTSTECLYSFITRVIANRIVSLFHSLYAWEILGFWKVRFSLYWLLLIRDYCSYIYYFFTNYFYLINYYKYLGDRAHYSSENWLIWECFFFKTMRMYWLLLYFTKLLYLLELKYNLSKACYSRVDDPALLDLAMILPNSVNEQLVYWLLEFVFTHDCVNM